MRRGSVERDGEDREGGSSRFMSRSLLGPNFVVGHRLGDERKHLMGRWKDKILDSARNPSVRFLPT